MVPGLCLILLAASGCMTGPEDPIITAADVVDNPTLKTFVDRAAETATGQIASRDAAYEWFDASFRPEGEWRHGPIYLFVYHPDGVGFFHAVTPSLEGQDLIGLEDKNGVKIIVELIAAANAGGGFVEYLWDNPAVDGDEKDGSRKVGYATLMSVEGDTFMIGSGYYPG